MKELREYQRSFIKFCIDNSVLKFGSFTLKSGRVSPYFFNAGLFNTGEALASLGQFYADALVDHMASSGVSYDVIFGPAYKGIPLASVLASTLFSKHGKNYNYAFNRKEAKDHGEGGMFVGAALKGQVLVVDDVITAGTAIRETVQLLKTVDGAVLAGVLVALDRKERGQTELSAIEQIRRELGVPVVCIVTIDDIVAYLVELGNHTGEVKAIRSYQVEYGSKD